MGQSQEANYICNWNPQKKGKEEIREKYLEEIMAKDFPKLEKTKNP